MQYREYGKGGPTVSRLGFGVMRLPARRKGDWGSVNFSRSCKVMRLAMEQGVNFFDSHHLYHHGLSEVAIGKALKGWKGQRIYLQTKTPFYNEEPIDYFKKLLDEALEKMGVNCIDYLLFHSVRLDTFKKRHKQFFKFTDWAMKRGLILHRGFSSHDSPENIKTFVDTGEFSCMLVSYNWLSPAVADVIGHAADKGMGVSIMNPVGGGTLSVTTPQILRLLPGAKSGTEVALRYVL
ncbi:MAG TPA: aldo/keto reductase, partial [bacterium]|nr:aldo/keto reductase [bacterium]